MLLHTLYHMLQRKEVGLTIREEQLEFLGCKIIKQGELGLKNKEKQIMTAIERYKMLHEDYEEEQAVELMVIYGGTEFIKGKDATKFMDNWYGEGMWRIDTERNGTFIADGVFVDNGEEVRVDDVKIDIVLITQIEEMI